MDDPGDSQNYPAGEDTLPDASPADAEVDGSNAQFISTARDFRGLVPLLLVAFLLGLGAGYLLWGRSSIGTAESSTKTALDQTALADEVNPPAGYTVRASFKDIGPRLLAAGAIDYDRFVQTYEKAGQPLTNEQITILIRASDQPIVINKQNAYFLLNLFWALGLTNANAILKEGPMMQYSQGKIDQFASTGGWTLGTRPATARYASPPIITLTAEQQKRLEEVASAVYRPCCGNATNFPDCNHGMAMLGLLELMASQNASADEMFDAAKYVNAFWFPQQMLELATFFKANQHQDFANVDARQIVGRDYSSGSGFRKAEQWLEAKGLLEPAAGGGSRCGV